MPQLAHCQPMHGCASATFTAFAVHRIGHPTLRQTTRHECDVLGCCRTTRVRTIGNSRSHVGHWCSPDQCQSACNCNADGTSFALPARDEEFEQAWTQLRVKHGLAPTELPPSRLAGHLDTATSEGQVRSVEQRRKKGRPSDASRKNDDREWKPWFCLLYTSPSPRDRG